MGKMTYKRRKNVKKQSFKKRKNKKMKGGDNIEDDASVSTPAGYASAGDVTEGVQETKVGNPQDDADYKQFLEDLKVNPDEILRKKVYLWESVEEFFIYDPHANKWKNERQTLNDDVSDTQGNTKNNPNESV